MSNSPQNSARLSLNEALAAMRRIGVAPEEYVQGYAAGFRYDPPLDAKLRMVADGAYKRGYWAGVAAKDRGAHSFAHTESEPLLYGDEGYLYGGAS